MQEKGEGGSGEFERSVGGENGWARTLSIADGAIALAHVVEVGGVQDGEGDFAAVALAVVEDCFVFGHHCWLI